MEFKRVLAIGAHPDDVEFGCGGVLQRFGNVQAVIVSDALIAGGLGKIEEIKAAMGILNITKYHRIGQQEGRFDAIPIIRFLDEIIAHFKPDLILCNGQHDSHQDHRALYNALLSALRVYRGHVWLYRTPSTIRFEPEIFVELSEAEWKTKLKAIAAHKTQADRRYFQPKNIEAAFQYWGITYRDVGAFVEPFKLFRAVY